MSWENKKKTFEEWLEYECRPRKKQERIIKDAVNRFPNMSHDEIVTKVNAKFTQQDDVSAKTERELAYYKEHFENTQRRDKFIDEIADLIKENVKPLNVIKEWKPAKRSSAKPEEEILIFNSDQHIGFRVDDKERPQGGMEYNPEVAEKRITSYSQTVMKIVENHRQYENIDVCHLLYLGDGIEGDWKGLNMSKDNIVEQYTSAFSVFLSQIQFFASQFREVHISSVYGNHSRMDKGQPEYINWEYILWKYAMSLALKNTKNVTLNIPSTPFGYFKIYDWKFAAIHGGGIKMVYKTPYYGIETAYKEYNEIFQELEAGRFNYLTLGHFHSPASLNDNKIKMCGSTVGYLPFAISALRKYCRPSQKICFVHKEHGIVQDRDIYLDSVRN